MRKLVIPVLVLAVLLVVAGRYAARPFYRRYKENHGVQMARVYLRRGEYSNAWKNLQQTLALNPNNVEACRMAADLADRAHSPAALTWRRKVAELDPSVTNRLTLVAEGLRSEPAPYPVTTKTLDSLKDATNDVSYHVLAAERAYRLNQVAEAEKHLETAIRLDPGNPSHALSLAVLRLQSTNAAVADAARAQLQAMSTNGEASVTAARALTVDAIRHRDVPGALEYSNRVLSSTNAGFADRLQHLEILWAAEAKGVRSAEFGVRSAQVGDRSSELGVRGAGEVGSAEGGVRSSQIGDRAGEVRGQKSDEGGKSGQVKGDNGQRTTDNGQLTTDKPIEVENYIQALKAQAGTNVAAIMDLGNWLNGHGKSAETVQWIETLPASVQAQMPLPLLNADGLIRGKQWAELEETLRDQQWGHQDFIRAAMVSLAARNQDEKDLSSVNWDKALRQASEKPEYLSQLAITSRNWGWSNEVETVLWTAVRLYPNEQWAKVWLERGYYGLGDTQDLLRLYTLMLEQNPKDYVAKNNLASAMLLLNTNIDRASALAQEAYDQHQTNAMVACTYAYSLQVQGKTAEALDVFKKMSDADRRRPGIAAYYSAVLNAAGDKEQAKVYRGYAEKGALLPEEKALLP